MWSWQPTNGRLERRACSFTPVDDPLENAHVFAKARPEELPVSAFSKPVYAKDLRRIRQLCTDVQPMLEILADVISAEWQHRHRIASHLANCAGRGRGSFRCHGGAKVNTMSPIKCLIEQQIGRAHV